MLLGLVQSALYPNFTWVRFQKCLLPGLVQSPDRQTLVGLQELCMKADPKVLNSLQVIIFLLLFQSTWFRKASVTMLGRYVICVLSLQLERNNDVLVYQVLCSIFFGLIYLHAIFFLLGVPPLSEYT